MSLLQTENYFDADLVLIHFQTGDWIEEKSILLSRLGRHKQALYVYTEGMPERALLYCEQVAHRCPEVYEYLLGRPLFLVHGYLAVGLMLLRIINIYYFKNIILKII